MEKSEADDCEIVVFNNASPPNLRRKAEELIRESPYAHCYFNPQKPVDPHAFLAALDDNFIGFLLMDIRSHDYTMPREKIRVNTIFAGVKEPEPFKQIWAAVCIWVKPDFRKRKIGQKLCLKGCSFWKTSPNEIGWATPITEAGEAMIKSLGVKSVKFVRDAIL